ncbi:MAG: type IV toxin-antitoxin system AbiEi family antitoxin domain-containing protein [Actinobacteria bacterium]|nr:type IV toxin-antitoxin system AbiEi family antitoxin domain-containing protein [Actinomycetota bacterium]MBU1943993.1 type IV toxin-antitoxin system AbiEi family antitoxin domain-containing protein [Actinomycetota bacterium]MBU2688489.1 type IV toxin-antitoxin system AbiEi family antitoxin domain-containing protein [Actinomycetota bacterium]
MRETELLKNLRSTPKAFFTISDLEKITGLDRKSLSISLNRWVKKGVLERARRNIYVVGGEPVNLEAIAGQAYFPGYLSFESALSRSGVLNLVPYTLSFATTRKTKSMMLLGRRVVYRHLKQELFFGFTHEEGLYVAEPEKALLDLAYFSSFGKATIPSEELDLRPLSKRTLDEYTRRFPPRVAEVIARLL